MRISCYGGSSLTQSPGNTSILSLYIYLFDCFGQTGCLRHRPLRVTRASIHQTRKHPYGSQCLDGSRCRGGSNHVSLSLQNCDPSLKEDARVHTHSRTALRTTRCRVGHSGRSWLLNPKSFSLLKFQHSCREPRPNLPKRKCLFTFYDAKSRL